MTTIHQPNSTITHSFDDLLLLARGAIVYMGEMKQAVHHFIALGHKCAPHCSLACGGRSPRARACSGGLRPNARAARRCPEYTNPTDFFMGLMKDDATAGTLADVWRKRYEGMVASAPPLPVAPISKRAVADDPTLAPGPEGYADGYKAEAFESAHSALEVRAQLSRCAVALCRRALPACLAVTGRKRAGARERGARSCDECRGGHTPAGEQRGARARAERRPVPDAGAVRPERPGNGRQGRSQPARGRPPQGLQRPRGARAGRQPRRQRRGCGPRPGRLAMFRGKVRGRAHLCPGGLTVQHTWHGPGRCQWTSGLC